MPKECLSWQKVFQNKLRIYGQSRCGSCCRNGLWTWGAFCQCQSEWLFEIFLSYKRFKAGFEVLRHVRVWFYEKDFGVLLFKCCLTLWLLLNILMKQILSDIDRPVSWHFLGKAPQCVNVWDTSGIFIRNIPYSKWDWVRRHQGRHSYSSLTFIPLFYYSTQNHLSQWVALFQFSFILELQ